MKLLQIALAVLPFLLGTAHAQEDCDLPGYLLFGDSRLARVAEAINQHKRLDIAVLGTSSSALTGADGSPKGYPSQLRAALSRQLPNVSIHVVSWAKPRQTAADMAAAIDKLLVDVKPALVLWQSGTVDAIRGVDPEDFRETLENGIERLQAGGADVVLINMQYSPRTETMIQLDAYENNMRAVARERDVPLFDRLNLMRYWNDTGVFDFSAPTKDRTLATKVHACLGRALAALVIEAANVEKADEPAQ